MSKRVDAIRAAYRMPVYGGGNPSDILRLVWAYRTYRLKGFKATAALSVARKAVEKGQTCYPCRGGIGAPFLVGRDSCRWIEDTADYGLRLVGTARSISRHAAEGWYLNEFQDETAFGVVYRLSARHGESRFVAGYRTSRDSDDSAAVCFETTDCEISAANWADGLAERIAETEREYQEAWRAGNDYSYLSEEIAELRVEILKLCSEIRAAGKSFSPVICSTLRAKISANLRAMDKKRRKRAELQDSYGRTDGFAEGMGV